MGVKLVPWMLEMKTNEVVRGRKVPIWSQLCTVIYWSTSPQCGFLLLSLMQVGTAVPMFSSPRRRNTWISLRKFYSCSPPTTADPNKTHNYKLSATRRPQDRAWQVRALLIERLFFILWELLIKTTQPLSWERGREGDQDWGPLTDWLSSLLHSLV